jgi:hypothetical protein
VSASEQPEPQIKLEPEPVEEHIPDPTEETEAPVRAGGGANVVEDVFRRLTPTGPAALSGKKEVIPRRMRTFMLDGQSCSPDVFVDASGEYYDLEITMRSLDSSEEIAALQGVNDPGAVPYVMAKASLYMVNGRKIPADKKDFLWECFGMGGRQLCLMAFQHVGSASGAALGKFRRSITVG